jgi:hypothetical protein
LAPAVIGEIGGVPGAAALECRSYFVLNAPMKLFLRPHRDDDAQGRQPNAGNDKDYAVIDGTPIGRIYADRLPSGEKWLWFLHILRATPNQGIADTLEDAKAALADSYRRHGGHMR